MVELITILIIVGILGAAVAPRFTEKSSFDSNGFHNETLALLRYAQKSAIAQRRTVCVTFTASTAFLSMATTAYAANCNTPLTGPKGDSPGTITAKSGITYAGTPTNVSFSGLGQPSAAQTIQITGAAKSIVIEAETGFVHES